MATSVCAVLAAVVPAVADADGQFQIGTFPVTPNSANIEQLAAVGVDQSGSAYVVWTNPQSTAINYCVVPTGATACAETGTLPQSASAPLDDIGTPSVVVDGSTVSVLAQGSVSGGTQEIDLWQTPDGQANFSLVNSGASVADPNAAGQSGWSEYDTPGLVNALVVPGTDELGVFAHSSGPPTFQAFPESSPPTCSDSSSPRCAFATLEPSTDAQPVGYTPADAVTETGPDPGVFAYMETLDNSGPLACSWQDGADGTVNDGDAFVYGSGLQSATNNYNVSPGQPDSAWRIGVTEKCPATQVALAAGPSGIGQLEIPWSGGFGLSYQPFDTSTASFDQPSTLIFSGGAGAGGLHLGQDGAGNLYAVDDVSDGQGNGSAGEPLALFYSGDGGKTWEGPAPVAATLTPVDEATNSYKSTSQFAVGAGGAAWLINENYDTGQIDAVQFSGADATNQFSAAVSPAPQVSGSTATVGLSCYEVPCTVTATLTSAGMSTAARKAHDSSQTLGSTTVTLTTGGVNNVPIPLNSTGQAAVNGGDGQLPATLNEITAVGAYGEQKSVPVTLTGGGQAGGGQAGGGTTQTSHPTPTLSRLHLSASAFTVGRGVTISFRDSTSATTTFVIFRRVHHRWVRIGSFTRSARAGTNVFHFDGRLHGRRLTAGTYRLEASSSAGGKTGKPAYVSFTVKAR